MNEDIKKEENIDGPAPAAEEQPTAETAAEQASEPTEQASAAEPEEKESSKFHGKECGNVGIPRNQAENSRNSRSI